MVMDSDEESVDRRLNLSLDKIMDWMGTREGIGEFRKDPTHFIPIPPPNLRDEDIDEPVQLKQEPQTSTSVSVLPMRPSRNRRPGRYQLSPYDQVSKGANPKYKAGPFQVIDPVTPEELNLIQYAFNKEADGSEIIVSNYGEILNQHSLLTLLPGAYLCGKVISMKAHHLILIQQVVEKDVSMNWYLPTRYSVSLAATFLGLDSAAPIAKQYATREVPRLSNQPGHWSSKAKELI
ncbi:hypothetical protein CUMW_053370 [Citrus unshiu]|nr:hypothetical protein CUMW_053370 [Citrus unshiu]